MTKSIYQLRKKISAFSQNKINKRPFVIAQDAAHSGTDLPLLLRSLGAGVCGSRAAALLCRRERGLGGNHSNTIRILRELSQEHVAQDPYKVKSFLEHRHTQMWNSKKEHWCARVLGDYSSCLWALLVPTFCVLHNCLLDEFHVSRPNT